MRKKYDLSQFTLEELLTMMEIVYQFLDEMERYSLKFKKYTRAGYGGLDMMKLAEMVVERMGQQQNQPIVEEAPEKIETIRKKLDRVAEEEKRKAMAMVSTANNITQEEKPISGG